MARKKVNVAELLTEGGFEPPVMGGIEPLAPTRIVLDIAQIKEYEGNPRIAPNQRYQEIKASIRADGLRDAMVVTKRPNDEHYIPAAGGNTRLRILKELWRETREDRFKTVEALFRPWVSEEWVLISHLIENELRGEMQFIDKARCIVRLRKDLEEKSAGPVSERQFSDYLNNLGFPVSRRQCRRFLYAISLEAVLPQAVSQLGATHIDELAALEKNYRIEERRQLSVDPFLAVLKQADNPKFSLKAFKRSLDRTITRQLADEGLSPPSVPADSSKPSDHKKNQDPDLPQALATALEVPEYVEEGMSPPECDSRQYAAWWCIQTLRCLDEDRPVPQPVPREADFLMRLGRNPELLEKLIARLRTGIRGEEA